MQSESAPCGRQSLPPRVRAPIYALSRGKIRRGATHGDYLVLLARDAHRGKCKLSTSGAPWRYLHLKAYALLLSLCCGARICHSDRVAVFVGVDSGEPESTRTQVRYWFSLSVELVFRVEGQLLPDPNSCWTCTSEFTPSTIHTMPVHVQRPSSF